MSNRDPERGDYERISQVQRNVDEVKNVMVDNIDKILSNQEKASDLEYKTNELQQNSFQFRRRSNQVRCQMLWENWKMTLIIAGIVLIVLVIIIAAASS